MSMVEDGDRDLMRRWLDAMSAKMKGQSALANPTAADLVPTAPFATKQDIDVPMAPGEVPIEDPMDPDADHAGHSHGNRTGSLAWGGHANGRIPTSEMEEIGQGRHRLWSPAARAWKAMAEAARSQGINLSLTDSYRTYDAQVRLRRERGHLVATATPGTSNHGWGRAVDANVKDPKVLAWLRQNGPRFGWINPDWAQKQGKNYEPWHWEFRGEG